MKKKLLFLVLLCAASFLPAQLVLENFESGAPTLNWFPVNGAVLNTVANPAPGPGNSSAYVGSITNTSPNDFAFILADLGGPMNFASAGLAKMRVWSPIAPCQVLLKFEGSGPAVEQLVTINTANQWLDLTFDMSAGASNTTGLTKCLIAFNPFVPAADETFYFDDLRTTTAVVVDDFENGAVLPWQPLDNLTVLHGSFDVVNNPQPSGINTSSKVGRYTKGTSPFSTVEAVAPGVFNLAGKPQYNLDIWAPTGTANVIMQLESLTQGNKEVNRSIPATGEWVNVAFDFSAFQNITDFVAMRILFQPGQAQTGTIFYFDNLTQGPSTVNPCENVVAIPNIIDDYECQRNYTYGVGASQLTVVSNPLISTANNSPKVGKFAANAGSAYQALCAEFPDGIDLTVFNQLEIMVLSPTAIPVLLKLEGGSSPAVETSVNYTTAGQWQKLTADFSGQATMNHKRACLFLNAGVSPPSPVDYHIDNFRFSQSPYYNCIANFESPGFIPTEWYFFPSDNSGAFELVDNPAPSAGNSSAKVGKAVEKAIGQEPWQGMFTDLPVPIRFGPNKLITMKVWSPKITTVTMKLEAPMTLGAPFSSGDNIVANTVANQWETLTWDFSTSPTPIPDNGDYRRITLIWDIQNVPTSDVIYYFDDISINNASCSTTDANDVSALYSLAVVPNPAADVVRVENLGQSVTLVITDVAGRQLARLDTGHDTEISLNTAHFLPGLYIITGFNSKGQPVAQARLIKI